MTLELKLTVVALAAIVFFFAEKALGRNRAEINEVLSNIDSEGRRLLRLHEHPLINKLINKKIGLIVLEALCVVGSVFLFVE